MAQSKLLGDIMAEITGQFGDRYTFIDSKSLAIPRLDESQESMSGQIILKQKQREFVMTRQCCMI